MGSCGAAMPCSCSRLATTNYQDLSRFQSFYFVLVSDYGATPRSSGTWRSTGRNFRLRLMRRRPQRPARARTQRRNKPKDRMQKPQGGRVMELPMNLKFGNLVVHLKAFRSCLGRDSLPAS